MCVHCTERVPDMWDAHDLASKKSNCNLNLKINIIWIKCGVLDISQYIICSLGMDMQEPTRPLYWNAFPTSGRAKILHLPK